ncbi:MAG TPA: glycosyltransferase family 39 protein [Candidatus Angelobacter sp.]|nr:glycosyltransferase family 39 protein [Candidatus Angelobacter sp.]
MNRESSKAAEIAGAETIAVRLTRILSSPLTIFLVALLARLVDLSLHPWFASVQSNHLGFAYEIGEVAQSIVEGRGFSSPFGVPTGPTAWYTPAYPLLLAGIFKIFGVYSAASAWVISAVNSFFAALTAVVIVGIGTETVGKKSGIAAAWLWALLPYVMQWSVRWVWETSLSALLLAAIVYATVRVRREPRIGYFVALGLLWAIVANANPTLLILLPVSLAWIWWRQRSLPSLKAGIATVLVLTVLGCVPWIARNYITMHYLGLRSNFGEELYLGNQPGAEGLIIIWKHPIWNNAELNDYQRLGEIAYIAGKRRLAVEFIRSHPGTFFAITLKRIAYFWCGAPDDPRVHPSNVVVRTTFLFMMSLLGFWGCMRAVRKKVPGGWLLLSVLVFYPLIFYITHTHVRYRHPVDPILLLAAAYLFFSHSQEKPRIIKTA